MNVMLTESERARVLAKSALFDPPAIETADGRRELVGLSREELAAELAAIGEKPFRAKQVWHWIYHQGVTEFDRMSSVARPLQQRLAERFVIGRPIRRHRPGEHGRHPQMAVPLPRRARGRDGLHSRPLRGSRCRLYQQPGRLHAVLPFLSHRHPEAGP